MLPPEPRSDPTASPGSQEQSWPASAPVPPPPPAQTPSPGYQQPPYPGYQPQPPYPGQMAPTPYYGMSRRTGFPIWGWFAIGCGGLAVLAVISIVALVILAATGISKAHCPPSDFAVPAGATQNGYNIHIGTGGSTCSVSWNVNQDVTSTDAFVTRSLSSGDWHITSRDESNGAINFARTGRPGVTGHLSLLGRGRHTQIEVVFRSDGGDFGP